MNVYIGTDGGGTKTRTVLQREDGRILADLTTPGCNLNHHGWEETLEILRSLFAKVRLHLSDGNHAAALCLGLAGVDREEERVRMLEFVQSEWPHALVRIENDAIPALAAGTNGAGGIVLIGGTGSIAYGVDDVGQQARVGGWGYLIGDEGSGYDIGRKALQIIMKSHDGRLPQTLLTELVLGELGIAELSGLIPAVYGPAFTRERTASLTKLVFRAAAAGDSLSRGLLEEAAGNLAELVITLERELSFTAQLVPVVLAGGLFHPGSPLAAGVRERLQAAGRYLVTESAEPPVMGAVMLARQIRR